ncbi:MAG: aldo/keto reductase [Candidatus Bathyarchaeota archaeon]
MNIDWAKIGINLMHLKRDIGLGNNNGPNFEEIHMRYRELGRTKLRVSEIGFGCGNVGGLMIRGSHEEQVQGVSRAIELGINYFDTASSYGDGLSETNLGRVLNELQPKDVIVATKVGLRTEDLSDIRGAFRKSLERSLSRLHRGSIDVFQLHTQLAVLREGVRQGMLSIEDVLGAGGVADVFDEACSQGLIRFSGFTGLGETDALHKVIASGRFDVVQVYYNLLNPSAGFPIPKGFVGNDFKLLIRKASEKRMGVVVIRVLAGGALGGEVVRQGYAAPSLGSAMTEGADYQADKIRAGKLQFLVSGEIQSSPSGYQIRSYEQRCLHCPSWLFQYQPD